MTQDEIIEMARDSGMELYGLGKDRARFVHHLEAFAKLVHTRGYIDGWSDSDEAKTSVSFEMSTDAVEAEREACAKVCEGRIGGAVLDDKWMLGFKAAMRQCAEAIRVRGQA
jgi:hypothetical protein